MSAALKSHQCHHKPVKTKKKKKEKSFFKGLTSFLPSPKTCYELLNIASEESTLGRQTCTLSRELETHSLTSCNTNVKHRARVTYLPTEVVSLILSIFSSSTFLLLPLKASFSKKLNTHNVCELDLPISCLRCLSLNMNMWPTRARQRRVCAPVRCGTAVSPFCLTIPFMIEGKTSIDCSNVSPVLSLFTRWSVRQISNFSFPDRSTFWY